PTQILVLDKNVIPILHRMEQMSSLQKLGTLAENLLEALKLGNPRVREVIDAIRDQTRHEKKRIAEIKREEMLRQMGLMRTAPGQGTIVATKDIFGLDELEEETGHCCIVCQEGYSFK